MKTKRHGRSRCARLWLHWFVWLFVGALALTHPSLMGATLVAWDSQGVAQNSFPYGSTTNAVGVTASAITSGAGLVSVGGNLPANVIGPSAGWSELSLAAAVTGNDYFEFFVTAAPGYLFSLDSLAAILRSTALGPNMAVFQYSLDGFSTAGNSLGDALAPSTGENGGAITPINLALEPALQNVSGTVTFRLYGWGGGTSTVNAMGFGRLAGYDLVMGGTVLAVPEPSRMVLFSLGVVSWLGRRRRY